MFRPLFTPRLQLLAVTSQLSMLMKTAIQLLTTLLLLVM
ncbi:Protein of unknown function [Lactobacillus helveticus CIRM-BIA 101]|nr:Protein of unknown function [Lactobacillus helveticus CIRM-BIA 103]CDI66456.1 Protein of unknown function [Lactobacillus helveticus CIRM-BIA 101]